MIGFGKNTNISSAKYVPYLYDRIKAIVLSFTNNSSLSSAREVVTLSSEYDGSNPDYSDTDITFYVFYGGINQTGLWNVTIHAVSNCTVSQVGTTMSVDTITADEAYYIVRASRADYTTLTKKIPVSKVKNGEDGTDGALANVMFATREHIAVPSYVGGPLNLSYVDNIFTIYEADVDESASWTISQHSASGVTINVDNPSKTVTITNIVGYVAEYVIKATKSGEDTIYKTIKCSIVYNGENGADGGGTVQNGNLSLQAGDEGSPVGDDRGNNAVDLQTSRGASTQVASGNYTVISGGSGNTASGDYSVIGGGQSNEASNLRATIGGGQANLASGTYSTVSGGYTNWATGSRTAIMGGNGNHAQTFGECVAGLFSNSISGNPNSRVETDPLFRIGNGIGDLNRSDAFRVNKDGSTFLYGLKSGNSQFESGATTDELWVDTLPLAVDITGKNRDIDSGAGTYTVNFPKDLREAPGQDIIFSMTSPTGSSYYGGERTHSTYTKTPPGEMGDTGTDYIITIASYAGIWSAGNYSEGDVVHYSPDNTLWRAASAVTAGDTPTISSEWDLYARYAISETEYLTNMEVSDNSIRIGH